MKITNLKRKLFDCALVALVVVLFYIFNIPCLFKLFFGIPCPGCGITRAWLSLLRLDFRSAFRFNPMFWSVPLLAWLYLIDFKPFKSKWLNCALMSLLLGGFLVSQIINLIKQLPS